MKTKSLYIQVATLIAVLTGVVSLLILEMAGKQNEMLDIHSDQKPDAIPVALGLNCLTLVMFGPTWWRVIFRNKRGLKTLTVLTIIHIGFIIYWLNR